MIDNWKQEKIKESIPAKIDIAILTYNRISLSQNAKIPHF